MTSCAGAGCSRLARRRALRGAPGVGDGCREAVEKLWSARAARRGGKLVLQGRHSAARQLRSAAAPCQVSLQGYQTASGGITRHPAVSGGIRRPCRPGPSRPGQVCLRPTERARRGRIRPPIPPGGPFLPRRTMSSYRRTMSARRRPMTHVLGTIPRRRGAERCPAARPGAVPTCHTASWLTVSWLAVSRVSCICVSRVSRTRVSRI